MAENIIAPAIAELPPPCRARDQLRSRNPRRSRNEKEGMGRGEGGKPREDLFLQKEGRQWCGTAPVGSIHTPGLGGPNRAAAADAGQPPSHWCPRRRAVALGVSAS